MKRKIRDSAPEATVPAIRLVAIDLDGTLLNSSKQVSEQTARALQCLPQSGVKVVIASARPPRSVRHIYKALRLDTLQINYNGALVWDEPNQRAIFHQPMERKLVRRMIERARDLFEDVLVTCEILDRWYTDGVDPSFTTETGRLFRPDVIAPIESFCVEPITKLLFLGDSKMISRLETAMGMEFEKHVTVIRTDEHLIQIMDKRVSKARSLQRVARHYGIADQQILAIGDAPNDVGMLQISGIAIAMDNAHPRVKQVADWIAPSNDDHGVHAALVRYGLCE